MTKKVAVTTIMRVVLGVLFLMHGIGKFQDGLGNIEGWFSSIGIPGFVAYIVAIIELVGGIMLIVGLFSRAVSALFIFVMVGAIATVKFSAGLLGTAEMPGYEMELSYILISAYLLVSEPTPLSVDYMIRKKRGVSVEN
ncbi:DoxX family protein [Paenibacillus albiflavus]|uniref:DoxX family protein n=1 Tax=Paenibacillus albiflavus TaxID=2545760 RepID=A0A4V2WP69_9BACL|nr:DoxX family protein [Paenibacillus albiflavus]TCZ78202.1 DoxX family protein [Paenibacillus albiflavus]